MAGALQLRVDVRKLRLILDGPGSGEYNMSRDARLLADHRSGDDPVLRIYRWSPPAVSCGYHQPDTDFDFPEIQARGFDFVRRPTGGRAILHAQELTYAVIGSSPSDLFGATLHGTYMKINTALVRFLESFGLEADISAGESLTDARGAICFRTAGRHEITVGGRKIIGSAQRRTEGVFLQHGSILTGPAHIDLMHCLRGTRSGFAAMEELKAATTDLGSLLAGRGGVPDFDGLAKGLSSVFADCWNMVLEVRDQPGS